MAYSIFSSKSTVLSITVGRAGLRVHWDHSSGTDWWEEEVPDHLGREWLGDCCKLVGGRCECQWGKVGQECAP